MTSEILNEHQRRHYHVLLSMLSQNATRLEALATPTPSADAAFVSDQDDLPPGFASRIEPHLRALRGTLANIAHEVHVSPKRLSRRNAVRAILVTEIVRLEDSLAKGLRGYGQVDRRVSEQLDPMLHSLIVELQAIRAALEGRG